MTGLDATRMMLPSASQAAADLAEHTARMNDMGLPDKVLLRAQWGGRVDTLPEQAEMMWQCMQRLASHGGFLAEPSWHSVKAKPRQEITVSTLAEVETEMTRTYFGGHGTSYSFIQGPLLYDYDAPPRALISSNLGLPKGGVSLAANDVLVRFEVGEKVAPVNPLPLEWMLIIGVELVKDFVDVWKPDAVSLDFLGLIRLGPRCGSLPVIGFQSWLSESVIDPDVLPDAPVREPYKNGMLFGVDPYSSDPVGDASRLATRVYESGHLRMVPFVQGEQGEPMPPGRY